MGCVPFFTNFHGMSSLFLLFRSLLLIPQLVDEQPHSVRLGVRNHVFTAEIQIIPEPLLIRRVAGSRDRPLEKDCVILCQYVVRDKNHVMLARNRLITQNGILSNCSSIMKFKGCVNLIFIIFVICLDMVQNV